jgi:hypothetical protein
MLCEGLRLEVYLIMEDRSFFEILSRVASQKYDDPNKGFFFSPFQT